MLRDYVEKLLSLDASSIREIAFLNEPLAHFLNTEEKQSLLEKSEACGRAMAENLKQKHGSCAIEKLVELCGGRIHEIYKEPDSEYTLFAYFERPADITINTANVTRTEELISEYELEALTGKISVRDMLLCHELYHLLESRTDKGSFVKQKHVCAYQLGRFKLMRRLSCLEEIAAMAFTCALLDLNFSPYIFNVIMLYAYHPEKAARLAADYTINGGI